MTVFICHIAVAAVFLRDGDRTRVHINIVFVNHDSRNMKMAAQKNISCVHFGKGVLIVYVTVGGNNSVL